MKLAAWLASLILSLQVSERVVFIEMQPKGEGFQLVSLEKEGQLKPLTEKNH
jgi:hypothetical protein